MKHNNIYDIHAVLSECSKEVIQKWASVLLDTRFPIEWPEEIPGKPDDWDKLEAINTGAGYVRTKFSTIIYLANIMLVFAERTK